MRISKWVLVAWLLVWAHPGAAAEVVITLPDHRLRYVLDTLCWTLTSCQGADRAGQVADAFVHLISKGRYDHLAQLEGTVAIRYDKEP